MQYTENRIQRISVFDVVARMLFHLGIIIGITLITYASYLISSGKIEALLMLLPGIFTLIGGLVIGKASQSD